MDATIIILIIVIGLVIAYLLWWVESKRREAYRVWARLHNWSYESRRDHETYRREFFKLENMAAKFPPVVQF